MDALELSLLLGRATGVSCERTIPALFRVAQPDMVEWSFNADHDPRGSYRVALWRPMFEPDVETLRGSGLSFAGPLWRETAAHASHLGLGAAFRQRDEPTLRVWSLSRTGDGAALAGAVIEAEPALEPAYHLLLDAAGSPRQFRAASVEGTSDRLRRSSLYVSLSTPAAAVRLLEAIGCRVTHRGNLFFKALLGLEGDGPRVWPVVWAARSVGENAGWKLYYFARSDPHRRQDSVLLDLVDASPALHDAWTHVRRLDPGPKGVVQFIGLTVRDADRDAEPAWTVYLSPH